MTADPHLRDAISALLDSELDAAERATAEAHLRACRFCAEELDATAAVRTLVRGLPPVEPPASFLAALGRPIAVSRRRQRPAAGVAAALAGVAVALAVVVLGGGAAGGGSVSPPVADLVERHAATASVAGDPISELAPVAVPVSFQP